LKFLVPVHDSLLASGSTAVGGLRVTPMLAGAKYSAIEALHDGRRFEIRALRPDDRADLLAAVSRTSGQSLYRRFFAVRRGFTEPEVAFFLNPDFVDHVALVAVVEESGRPVIVGGGRYVVVQPGKAEVAFAVVDQYQGQGIGAALMRHLAAIARRVGLEELVAEVLPDNIPMLKVFEKSGLRLSTKREPRVVHVLLRLV
jgi:RimJ/RimL family protein N-acetyltransferase